jgi:hypothetical protein
MAEPEDEICGRILLDVLDQNVNSEKIINWLQNNDPNELFKVSTHNNHFFGFNARVQRRKAS